MFFPVSDGSWFSVGSVGLAIVAGLVSGVIAYVWARSSRLPDGCVALGHRAMTPEGHISAALDALSWHGSTMPPLVRAQANELAFRIVSAISDALLISKDGTEYHFGGYPVSSKANAIRLANSISDRVGGLLGENIRLAQVNLNRDNLERIHGVISSQLGILFDAQLGDVPDAHKQKLAADVADVLLTSWYITDCPPNASGWSAGIHGCNDCGMDLSKDAAGAANVAKGGRAMLQQKQPY